MIDTVLLIKIQHMKTKLKTVKKTPVFNALQMLKLDLNKRVGQMESTTD